MNLIDLDRFETWPEPIRNFLDEKTVGALIAERDATLEFDLSAGRWFKSPPPKPAHLVMSQIVEQAIDGWEIRVFHATRLLDWDSVRLRGLAPLHFQERLDGLRTIAKTLLGATHAAAVEDRITAADLTRDGYAVRRGQVWATPLRRFLHDGGCRVFFESWGGEFVERIAGAGSTELSVALKSVGSPACVVAVIPAAWDVFLEDGMVRAMIDLAIERREGSGRRISAWDVLVRQPIPPERIEAVVAPEDASVAWPMR